jgi:hypothetical protein
MFFEQDTDRENSPVLRFRKHRHDILNQLQLIRAYVQIGRQPDAIRIVDETARWLQSLTMWQTYCTENAERLVFAASNCPHLFLASADEIEDWDANLVDEIEQTLHVLEQYVSEKGWSPVPVYLRKPLRKGDPVQLVVEILNQVKDCQTGPTLPGGENRTRIVLTMKYDYT